MNGAWAETERSPIPADISLITNGGTLPNPSANVTSIYFDTNVSWELKAVTSGTTDQDKFPRGITPNSNASVSGFPSRKGYVAIVPAVAGTMKIYMISRNNSNKSAIIANSSQQQVATVTLDNSGEDYLLKSSAEFDVQAGVTYYIYSGSTKIMYAGYEFTPAEAYTTNIPINALRYRPGQYGISASNGMDRSVGGFNISFTYEAYNGIKCNNTNNILFRSQYQAAYTAWNHGEMTIALDANNSSKTISRIELCYDSNDFTDLSKITVSSGSLTDDTSNKKLVWTGSAVSSVTFTANYTDDTSVTKAVQINQINVVTSGAPTFTPVTPTISFSDDESTTLTRKGSFTPTVETTPDNFMWEYLFNANSTGVTHTAPTQNSVAVAGTLDASAVSATGNATITANFGGNTFFNNVANAGTYTLSITDFIQFTSGEPYEWKFNDPTWWETTSEDLSAATGIWYFDSKDNIYKSSTSLSESTLKRNSETNLPETNNLLFSNESSKTGRIGVVVGSFLWLNGGGSIVKMPELPAGTKITAKIASHSGTQNPTIDGKTFSVGSGGSECSVTLSESKQAEIIGGGGVNKVFYIKVEKGTPILEKVSGSETFNLNNNAGDDASTHNLVLRVSKGISVNDLTVTIEPSTGLLSTPIKTLDTSTSEYNTLTISLTGTNTGTGKVTVTYAGSTGNLGFNEATPVVYNVRVIRQQTANVWAFDTESYWTSTKPTPAGYDNTIAGYGTFLTQSNSKWENTSGTDYKVTTKVSNIELKAYNDVIPATEGLLVTASSGGVHLNIGNYMSLEGGSAASIRIPSLVTGQHVVFKTVADGGECGVMTSSSNLRLVSGQPGLDGKDAYYTFHVVSDGDGVFNRTNTSANLKIKYIEIIDASTNCNEMKFINTSTNADVSNTLVSVASGTSTLPFKLSREGEGPITYYVNDVTGGLSVTGNTSDGTFTLSGTGTAKIEASLAANGSYQKSYAVMYVSVKNAVTVQLTPSTTSYIVTRGTNFNDGTNTVTGNATPSRTVYYKSSNEAIARVNSSGVVTNTGEGTVTITAYTLEDDTYLAGEASYTITYTPNSNLSFNFLPNSGLLNLSTDSEERYIIPYLNYAETGTGGTITFDEITFESSNEDVATVTKLTGYGTSGFTRAKIIATNDESKVGQSAVITAIGKSGSVYYYTTYTVTITAEDECNFAWANANDIYMYEGDYMEIPAITGNANGNESLNKSVNEKCGYYWSLKQSDEKVTSFKYYNKDYRRGEGEPDYTIIQEGVADNKKSAYILVGNSAETRTGEHPTTLLVYARKEGTVRIHATDSQNDTSCPDITLHIMPKSTIYGSEGELDVEQQSVSYPYTWDFTRDFTSDEIASMDANSYYWEPNDTHTTYYSALALQNSDYCDDNHDGNNSGSQRLYKALLANHHTMPVFKGMKVQLQGTDYDSKFGKIHLKPSAGEGYSHLSISGGPHVFELPKPGNDQAEPDAYRVYFKIKATQANRGQYRIFVNGTMTNDVEFKNGGVNANDIYYKEVTKGQSISLGFQDVDVYWIAFSTEEKEVYQPGSTSYPSSTYSYSKALDLGKSAEVNEGLTTYYASDYDATTNSVTMSSLSENVESGKGLLLRFSGKTTAESEPLSCYMIADPENKDGYVEPSNASTDYLVGTVDETVTPSRFTTVGSDKHTNFVLTNVYWKVYDDGESDDGVNVIDDTEISDDWKFVRTAGNVEVGPQKAYLRLPGRLLNLNTSDGSASRAVLNIVFDDDAEATGIANVKQGNSIIGNDDGWYTLQGVKVMTPTKGGIYIHNGKKVAIK